MLADLGKKLSATFQHLSSAAVIDQKFLDDVLRDVCKALLEADVKWVTCNVVRKWSLSLNSFALAPRHAS